MPRPTATERLYDETSCRHRSAWPAILLASPLGLLIAMIVVSEIRTTAPAVVDAVAAGIVMPEPPARPQPAAVPAAIGPALGTTPSARERVREVRIVPAARLQALIADPAVRDFKGLSENAWDFSEPAGVPGFGPYRDADHKPDPGAFKLTSDE